MTTTEHDEQTPPTVEDAEMARRSSQTLARFAGRQPVRLQIQSDDGDHQEIESVTIPAAAFRLLMNALNQMAQGNAVTMIPVHAELTTQQAAEVLNVSRPFVIKLIDDKLLPCKMVGTHRRVVLSDLMAYKQKIDAERLKVLDELAAQAQELGMGY